MATIQITRPKEWANRLRSYKIILNNNKAGNISNDGTLTLAAPAGMNTLVAKMDWCRSQEIHFFVAEGETKYIEVSASKLTKWLPYISLPFLLVYFLLIGIFNYKNPIWIFIPSFIPLIYLYSFGRKKYLDIKEF